MLITFLGDGILSVVRRVCFHNEHVSFAATNPIESRRGPSISGPSLVSNTRKPGRAELTPPEQSENRSVALCQVVRGSRLTTFFYLLCVSVFIFFDFELHPFFFANLCCCFALSEKKKADVFRDRAETVPLCPGRAR